MQFSLDRAALLLVDVQRDALHPNGALGRAGQAPEATEVSRLVDAWGRLVDLMRGAGRPIVWVKTSLRPDIADSTYAPLWLERQRAEVGPFFIEGSWGAELMDGLDAVPDDYVVIKKGHSAYDNTHLDRLLTHPEPAHIVRLAATAGVEYRAIQLDGALIGVLRGYVRAEFAAITIVLV